MTMKKYYIADGVYMDFDGYQIRLWTERESGIHEVYLEEIALKALNEIMKANGWET